MIFPFGSSSALPESPTTLEKSPKEGIVTEAKNIVDARLMIDDSIGLTEALAVIGWGHFLMGLIISDY